MPRKKILFVIVEGPSDDAALSVLLSRFFDSNVVHVHVMHCDITTELGVTPNNIVRTIGDCVKKFAGRLYKSGDFCQIIHIVDMDGACRCRGCFGSQTYLFYHRNPDSSEVGN